MTISVCMILFNEEKTLKMSLESAHQLADEIIVVDNGSSDKTIDILNDYNIKPIINKDRSSKSMLRNQAINASTENWIVILDGDERIVEPKKLRDHLLLTRADAIFLKIVTPNGKGLSFHQLRCWQRGKYEYKYRSHEVPIIKKGAKVTWTDTIEYEIEHHQPTDRWPMKLETTLARLILDVHENPGDARPLFYLGRQYKYLSMWKQAIETFKSYFMCPSRHDDIDAHYCLGEIYVAKKEITKSQEHFYQAIALSPRRRDIWVQIANNYKRLNNYNEAVAVLKAAENMPLPIDGYIYQEYYDGSLLNDEMARALWKAGRIKEGQEYAARALASDPNNKRLQENLKWFENG